MGGFRLDVRISIFGCFASYGEHSSYRAGQTSLSSRVKKPARIVKSLPETDGVLCPPGTRPFREPFCAPPTEPQRGKNFAILKARGRQAVRAQRPRECELLLLGLVMIARGRGGRRAAAWWRSWLVVATREAKNHHSTKHERASPGHAFLKHGKGLPKNRRPRLGRRGPAIGRR